MGLEIRDQSRGVDVISGEGVGVDTGAIAGEGEGSDV